MKTVLLVEDDPMISEIYQRKLKDSDFSVDTAMSAGETLAKAKEKTYDVILLDVVLPEMNGLEILEKMRSDSAYPSDMKVIMLSNLNDEDSQEKATHFGALGYIEKSLYSPSEMVTEMVRLLHEAEERERNGSKRQETSFGTLQKPEDAKKILFIEDAYGFAETFGGKLRDEGYAVEFVARGDEGLRLALEKNFDMVITNYSLPGLEGDEIIRGIRENETTKNLPVILFSSSADDDVVERIASMDVQGFFLKTKTTPGMLARYIAAIFASMDAK